MSLVQLRIAVVRERREGETRVALVPDLVSRLSAHGHHVVVEPDAGARAGFADAEYVAAGASIGALGDAELVLGVQALEPEQVRALAPGSAAIAFGPYAAPVLAALRDGGVAAYAMEQVPRISRAQSMDALTSQSMVAGYRAVVVAADLFGRTFALTTTASGTIPAARVLVLGAGVAGLQAIATARRLGALVSGYDVRRSSAEEIASLGATPLDLGLDPLDGAAGYAREMTPARSARQRALLAPYVAQADVLITTAAVPGRTAPVLVSREMVEAMSAGSVVVDLAAESGGNVEGAVAGEVIEVGRAAVWGGANVPGQMPRMASTLYAQNVVNLVALIAGSDADQTDEIVRACRVDAR
ncbi:MAG TPA: NAD(P) transhydrogenase subunit alpha [Marmoricola sp.]|nr:NAD(P) transhydrogenase subunit alpha [Marmoricola sp.]